ncbi:hypothetical protein BaRGS_00004707 [Batillaria attramentaria]|uniref:Uncharacterized protein n=1 Tax=Batillaria attramentaria TaxID=370345 RepID=A0ABD0LWG4_9CAEN
MLIQEYRKLWFQISRLFAETQSTTFLVKYFKPRQQYLSLSMSLIGSVCVVGTGRRTARSPGRSVELFLEVSGRRTPWNPDCVVQLTLTPCSKRSQSWPSAYCHTTDDSPFHSRVDKRNQTDSPEE